MLRIIVSKNAQGATKYFTEALSVGDYYAEGQKCIGIWRGRGSELLGLNRSGRTSEVTREQFAAIANNVHPIRGGPLTARMVENRRVGYDFNFHIPKSVSVVFQETQDQRILKAFRSAVQETMEQIESEMKCRVRVRGAELDRTIGNLCWAEFIHHTARPVDGIPDPHLHAHCFVFNAVWDEVEEKWKAGQFGDIKHDAPFFEASFHARLASKMVELGYDIERRAKGWELSIIPDSVVRDFSRRTNEIEAKAAELGIFDAERKSQLGAKTRSHKNSALTMGELRKIWSARLDESVKSDIHKSVKNGPGSFGKGIDRDPVAAIDFAAGKLFERQSVVTERELHTQALRRSLGAVPIESLQNVVKRDQSFIRQEGDELTRITTREILKEEDRMLEFARKSRGTKAPIAPDHIIQDKRLNPQQRAAVMHALGSTDGIMIIRGGAGTGKTTLMSEAVGAINRSWLAGRFAGDEVVTILAPTADAGRDVLRREGFQNADTVAKFLHSEKMQERAKGGVLWIDEAGLLGSRIMAQVIETANKLKARIILSGDPGQHRAVDRGDPLRLFKDYAGIEPAYVQEIQRQRGLYKSAVEHLSRGEIARGFEGLRKLGWIQEVDSTEAHRRIAYDYCTTVEKGRSTLIVSPTHAEGKQVTKAVREEMERRGVLRGKSRAFDRLEDLRWTEAEKGKADLYQKGMVVQFHQNVAGFKAGKKYTVVANAPGVGVILSNVRALPLNKAKQFNVYQFHKDDTELKTGDSIRITCNGRTVKAQSRLFQPPRSHAINNGACYKVSGFTPSGKIRLENGWVVDKDYGHFSHGYCTTSPSSQGKTVHRVLIAQSANSFGATTAEQFYVSVSRGKAECAVYTDDIEGLRRQIERTTYKPLAVELSAHHEQMKLETLAIKMAQQRAREEALEQRRERELAFARTREVEHVR